LMRGVKVFVQDK